MNSKVEISQTRRGLVCVESKCGTQLAQSQSVPSQPLLAPIYRWPGLEDPVRFDTNYNVCIRHHLVFDYIYT
jgi:CDP-diacylglycerol pyrophosphatase